MSFSYLLFNRLDQCYEAALDLGFRLPALDLVSDLEDVMIPFGLERCTRGLGKRLTCACC